jgi:hypothetical protein
MDFESVLAIAVFNVLMVIGFELYSCSRKDRANSTKKMSIFLDEMAIFHQEHARVHQQILELRKERDHARDSGVCSLCDRKE